MKMIVNTLKTAIVIASLAFGSVAAGGCSAGVEVGHHDHGPGCGHTWDGHHWR